MAHALDQQIQEYLPLLDAEEKQSLLGVIAAFMKLKKSGGKRISAAQYNKELDEALSEVRDGRFTTQEQLEKEAQKW